jgi:hypothetical protein
MPVAAEELTKTLQVDPHMTAASRRLCWLLGKGKLPDGARLNRQGLKAALAHDTADRDLLTAATIYHLSQIEPLRRILERGSGVAGVTPPSTCVSARIRRSWAIACFLKLCSAASSVHQASSRF